MELSPHDAAGNAGKSAAATRDERKGKQDTDGIREPENNDKRSIVVGKIASPFGVQGWAKVLSYTEPATGLLDYPAWQLKQRNSEKTVQLQQGREHGKFLVVKFDGIDGRDEVAKLTNALIEITRDQFPDTDQDSF